MMPQKPRDAAVDWIAHVIERDLPAERLPRELAESLVAICEDYKFDDSLILEWIDYRVPGKEFSASMFRRHCEDIRQLQLDAKRLEAGALEPRRPPIPAPCSKCGGIIVFAFEQRFCANCGGFDQ